jgi:putative oxidoreductase
MRLVAGIALIVRAFMTLRTGPSIGPAAVAVLAIAAGLLIVAGLWTPIASSLVFVFELWNAASRTGDPFSDVLLATIGAALALLGPGGWSVDARLFGWKRIDIPDSKK